MEYRLDKRSGNSLSILGFGCMRLPTNLGSIDMKKTERLIMYAIEKGVNYFDTAYIYSGSEEALGTILKKNNVREKVYIATKLPLVIVKTNDDFDNYFYKELERLKTDYIDYYLMHMLTSFDHWKSLKAMGIEDWISKKRGEVRQIGFSFHGSSEDFLKILDDYDWDFCQIQYNYSDENYQAGVKGLKRAYEKNIPIIIMEPLLGGKLVNNLPPKASNIFKKYNSNISLASWGLRWLWNQEEVTVVLSGMNDFSQVEDNIKTAETSKAFMLSNEEKNIYKKVRKIFKESNKIPCTGCNYCMPCPYGVNIPSCFTAFNSSYSMGFSTGYWQYIMGTGAFFEKPSSASLCQQCGICEKKCPQKIEIRNELQKVKKKFETPLYNIVLRIAKKFMKI